MSAGIFLFASTLTLAILSAEAGAADIYRWVDEKGHTHVADVVPPRYKDSATRIDTRSSEVSEQQRAEAQARAAREKAAQASAQRESAPPVAAEPGAAGKKTDRPAAKNNAGDCEQQRRAYDESQACFVRYATQWGIKGEAYEHCTSVPDPSPQCGIPSN
jgi:hypothetical protein